MYIHNWCTICGIALNKNHKWKKIIYFKDYTVIIIYIYIYKYSNEKQFTCDYNIIIKQYI